MDLGSGEGRESFGAPLLRVFSQTRLRGQTCQHLQEKAIQVVIGRRAKIRAATVPTPLSSVVPAWQSILEPVDSLFKQAAHHRIFGFDVQVIKTDEPGHETLQEPPNRPARDLPA